MADRFDPPLEIDLGDNPRKISFRSVKKAKAWAQMEQQAWVEFGPANAKSWGIFFHSCIQNQRNVTNQTLKDIAQAQEIDQPTVPPNDVANTLNNYAKHNSIHSESALGKLLLSEMKAASSIPEQKQVAAILAAACGTEIPTNAIQQGRFPQADLSIILAGAALYQIWNAPTPRWAEAERAAISDALAESSDKLSAHEKEFERATTEIHRLEEEIGAIHDSQQKDYRELKEGYEKKFVELKEFYEAGLRTKAPVKYWKSKSFTHSMAGIAMIAVFLAGSIGAAVYGFQLGIEFSGAVNRTEVVAAFDAAQGETAESQASQPIQAPATPSPLVELAFSKFVILLVPGFFAVWVLRIVLKVGLSNLALADDARHRVTLVETFLAMMEHSDKLSEADRILMLQALFRPIPGSTDDDTGPPNWFDMMTQKIRGKS